MAPRSPWTVVALIGITLPHLVPTAVGTATPFSPPYTSSHHSSSTVTVSPHLSADMNANGGVTISVCGQPWLVSGGLRLHAHNEWHGTDATRIDTDTTNARHTEVPQHSEPDTTATHHQSSSAGHGNTPTNTGTTRSRHDETHGTPPTPAPTPLPPVPPFNITGKIVAHGGVSHSQGTDKFGTFTRTSMMWVATTSTGIETRFVTGVRTYTSSSSSVDITTRGSRTTPEGTTTDNNTAHNTTDNNTHTRNTHDTHSATTDTPTTLVVFEQTMADGAPHTNYVNITLNNTGQTTRGGADATVPFLQWPSFDLSPTTPSVTNRGGGFLTWRGTFVTAQWGAGAPQTDNLGLTGGPVVLFDNSTLAQPYGATCPAAALVVSPASHFKGAVTGRWGPDWVAGVSGEVEEVPAGYTHDTILAVGTGISGAVDTYGKAMRSAFKTKKVADPATSMLGYWTDNGAYYNAGDYPQADPSNLNLSCCSKNKLLAAKAALDKDKIPIQYLQLDDWWYTGPRPSKFLGVKCVNKWEMPADTYPGGLSSLRSDYGKPFLLYGPYFCTDNQWNQTLVPAGSDAGVPPASESKSFYAKVFEYLKAKGGVGFEVDFMSELYLGIPEFRRTLDAATGFLKGMNDAAADAEVPIQFCMMQPSDLLASVELNQATNGRSSDDYVGVKNWDVGESSVLFWALGMPPSKDTFWSTDGEPLQDGFQWQNPGTNAELNTIIATLTTGPVGPSDGAGLHNTTRLMRTCDTSGRLLQPDKPLTASDVTFRSILPGSRSLNMSALWTTYSQPSTASTTLTTTTAVVPHRTMQYHVLAVTPDRPGLPLLQEDLYPYPTPNTLLLHRDWHRDAPCVDGRLASTCLHMTTVDSNPATPLFALNNGTVWPVAATRTMQLHTITTAVTGSWVLLGELDKFVPLSSVRFSDVTTTAEYVSAKVACAPGETVHVTALQPVTNPHSHGPHPNDPNSSTAAASSAAWKVVVVDVTADAPHVCLPVGAKCPTL
eukprot:m.67416 g.67416  ORF g.67416 m.67416 type:complete len:998 (+) comp8438_c0_seq1:47-3040(+)